LYVIGNLLVILNGQEKRDVTRQSF